MRSVYAVELPEHLESGAAIITPKWHGCGIIVRTSKKNKYGERLYRLKYTYTFLSGTTYTLVSNQPYYEMRSGELYFVGYGWTRDQLAQMGALYIPKKDIGKSRVLLKTKKRIYSKEFCHEE